MIPYERQQTIVEALKSRDILKMEQLQQLLPNVSESTLRRDIRELEDDRQVQRLSRDAIKAYATASELPLSTKATLQVDEKRTIARIAARYVSEDDTIYLDSGTTCTALLAEITGMRVHVVTTNPDALRLVTESAVAEVVITGGTYSPGISSLYGPLSMDAIERYAFDEAFLGANGVDVRFGVTTPHLEESSKKRAVVDHAKRSFLLCDSSKFHKVSAAKVCELDQVTIISDKSDERIARQTRIICA
jgi:DeoR family fructose operon transcriptional repressor